jgi:hypothetical protein
VDFLGCLVLLLSLGICHYQFGLCLTTLDRVGDLGIGDVIADYWIPLIDYDGRVAARGAGYQGG